MLTNELISKLIDLQDQANALILKVQQLQSMPKKEREASRHQRKVAVLNSNIQRIIRKIASASELHPD